MTPHPDEQALWAAIRAAPDDDLPRLVYADWLDERGRGDRAEFIRLQCRLAALPSDRRRARKERSRLEARNAALVAEHADGWLALLRVVLAGPDGDEDVFLGSTVGVPRFVRGFADFGYCDAAAAARLAAAGDDLEPVNGFHVIDADTHHNDWTGPHPEAVEAVAAWPGAGCVRTMHLEEATDRTALAVAGSASLRNLTLLELTSGPVTDAGAAALAAWPLAGRLEHLRLTGTRLTDAGAAALADSPHLGALRTLDVRNTPVTPSGLARLRRRFPPGAVLPLATRGPTG